MGVLTIDLEAIRENYEILHRRVGPGCAVAPVVKADAYGLGAGPVAAALARAGAEAFFVATLEEALALRGAVGPGPEIFTLNGFDGRMAPAYPGEAITPVLNYAGEAEEYAALSRGAGRRLPAAVHIDTGMNRLGAREGDLPAMREAAADMDLKYVMSHFACADEAGHEMNARQHERFSALSAHYFPGVWRSLANSSGIFRSPDYYFDTVRPGMAIYGLNPAPERASPMRPALDLRLRVLQVKTAEKDETCGYSATHRFDKEARIAIVSAGYADGLLRSLSGRGTLFWKDYPCPVRGRVSMDLVTADLSAVPENETPVAGEYMEALGPYQSADDLAAAAGTLGYEILTGLGRRYRRAYRG